jgi:hypothetical protein
MNKNIRILLPFVLTLFSVSKIFSQDNKELSSLLEGLRNANDSLKAKLYSRIGFYYMTRDIFDSSLYYTNLGLLASEKTGDKKAIANSYNNMGSIYRIYSDYKKAGELFIKAFEIYDKYNYYREAARTRGNISAVYAEQQQYEKALEQLFIANQYAIKAKDTITLIQNYVSLSNNYSFLENTIEARTCVDSGLALVKEKKKYPFPSEADSAQFAYVSHSINVIFALQLYKEKKFDSSILLYRSELSAIDENSGIRNKVDLMQGLSENFIEINKNDSALFYMDLALHLLKEDSIPKSYKDVYKLRAVIFEKMGRYKEALTAQQRYKVFSDSISNNENVRAITNIQTLYETGKKDQQIARLKLEKRRQNTVIGFAIAGTLIAFVLAVLIFRSRRLQRKLYKQKEETEKKERQIEKNELEMKMTELEQMALRAQMNPHFIFNSLNSVQHFIMNKDVEGVNKYLGTFAHLIRQTLNNSGKQLVSIDEEVKYLDTYLALEKMKSNDSFNYIINVKENVDRSATFVPGMILQPFVENSIKHGVTHKEKNDGLINISISKNGKLVCLVEDNGIGRKKAGEIKLAGEGAVYESTGMTITMNRIETINKIYHADISLQVDDVNDSEGKPAGTRVKLEFPPDME